MSEIIRSLLVVLFIALATFQFAKAPFVDVGISPKNFDVRRNAWFGVTLALFLSNNFWLFLIICAIIFTYGLKKDLNPFAFAMALLFAAPLVQGQVSGLGIVNYLVDLNYFRIISVFILLPLALRLRKEKGAVPFGSTSPEKLLIAYLVLGLVRQILVDTSTNTLRTFLYDVTDVILPYYVASRYFKTIESLREAMASFVLAAAIMGLIGGFEFFKGWLLYSNIPGALGTEWGLGGYLMRGANLRGTATTGQAIVLGYAMVVALGFYLFVSRSMASKKLAVLGLGALLVGLLAPLSRGPWMGALLLAIIYIASGPDAWRNLVKNALIALIVFSVALATPYGPTIIDHLPFIGTLEADNVTYRERLFTNSMTVIMRNFWFGSYDFMDTPEMQELKFTYDGGIIDLVNSYIAIALSGGITALAAFTSFFGWIVIKLFVAIRNRLSLHAELRQLQRVLMATLLAILFMIIAASSIALVPIIYWIVAGFCMSALRMDVNNGAIGA